MLKKAEALIELLKEHPTVRGVSLYGSLKEGTADGLSDIDLEVDVSGYDNGKFMLELVDWLGERMPVVYWDYAPSLMPERYVVSVAMDESNPFLVVDFCCVAKPHFRTVSPEQAREKNDGFSHLLKLWTANLKHYARGRECRADILRMAEKAGIAEAETKKESTLLLEMLSYLENNAPPSLARFMASCRRAFLELVS